MRTENILKYSITEFDSIAKTLRVDFDDGSWARIRLSVPLPSNLEELESIIKQFAAPVEVVKAQQAQDVDLSYITNLIGMEQTTERLSVADTPVEEALSAGMPAPGQVLDPILESTLKAQEELDFENRIKDVLIKLGLLNV